MRIEFHNAAREDFRWSKPRLSIGAARDNDLVLAASQAAAHHLVLQQDRRGWVLQVLPAAERIHVNARPVRERALLRAGDVISVGDCRMLLRDEQDPAQRVSGPLSGHGCRTVALRAVAGPLSGRVLPVRDSLELGPQGPCRLALPLGEVAALRLHWKEGQLCLASVLSSARHPLRVNGVMVHDEVVLLPDDQIGLDTHRFVVDAPGMEPEPEIVVSDAADSPLPEEAAGPVREVWWLIVTAAILALGIALVLLIRF